MYHNQGVSARRQLRENSALCAALRPDCRADKTAAIRRKPTFPGVGDSVFEAMGIVVEPDQKLATVRTDAVDRESQFG
jgi:hypothetical protein